MILSRAVPPSPAPVHSTIAPACKMSPGGFRVFVICCLATGEQPKGRTQLATPSLEQGVYSLWWKG